MLDFGTGFYLTTDFEQTKRWTILTTSRKKEEIPTVNVFEIEDKVNLKVLKFNGPDKEWLEFVTNNEKNKNYKNDYDLIIGPVANDNTMPVINPYVNGVYNEKEALKRLLLQKLKDQVVLNTLDELGLTDFIYNMYERYHCEAIENAFKDVDDLIEEKKQENN